MARSSDDPFKERYEFSKTDEDLINAYRAVNRTVDDLAYTDDFERMYKIYQSAGHQESRHEVFRQLLLLRKSGLLPRLFRPAATSSS